MAGEAALRITVFGADPIAVQFVDLGRQAQVRAVALVNHFGLALQTQVKANASGRPGPRAPTGDYRRSISLEIRTGPDQVLAIVGTNKPQGRRLEFGFIGIDSRGRHYNQPPYRHFGPALESIAPRFYDAARTLVA